MKIAHQSIKLTDYKELSLSNTRIKKAPLPTHITLLFKQSRGVSSRPIVQVGDPVLAGSLIAVAQTDFSSNLHSSISGIVKEINSAAITIESDGKDEWETSVSEQKNWREAYGDEITGTIFEAGIIDSGEEGFPVHAKIKIDRNHPEDDILWMNGCESDAYMTSDYVLMLNHPIEILQGITFLLRATGKSKCVIVIQDNKLDAIEILLSKVRGHRFENIEVLKHKTKYPDPLDREKHSIYHIATAFAIYEAIRFRKPFVERIMTVTGQCVVEPKNLWCRFGTSVLHLAKSCKGFLRDPECVIFGGPMSGESITDLEIPVTKLTNGFSALPRELMEKEEEKPCIRCGDCIQVCPEGLLPETLMRAVRKNHKIFLNEFEVDRCTECGNCTFICPSKIPLASLLKEGKILAN